MRFLIAGYSHEDSFADNVRCALEEMGHEVRTLGDKHCTSQYGTWSYYFSLFHQKINPHTVDEDGKKLLRIARKFCPNIVLSLTREYTSYVLAELKQISDAVMILWWGDTPANARRWGMMDRSWDLVFLKDATAVQKTRLVRDDVYLLHEAMNPRWHKPLVTQSNQSVVVAGNWYAFRQALVRRLMSDGVDVALYGSSPPYWSFPEIREAHSGRYIVRDEKSRIFGEALACLNSFQYSEGNSLNCRAFEIAGAGGLQLIEHRPAIEQCFEPGKELLVFRTYEELLDLIERARSVPEEMLRIREAGARRALAEHTYRHRLETILGYLQ
jgi:spore maturation protein CgeB